MSRGIGIGRVVFLHGEKRRFFRIDLDESQVEVELQRFRSAVADSVLQLKDLAAHNAPDPNHPVSGIFGVHLLIIEESSLTDKIELAIRTNRVNAEWALKLVTDQYIENQEAAADMQFREKYLDIEDVVDRLLKTLIGKASNANLPFSGAVVVSRELRPSAIMELTKGSPGGADNRARRMDLSLVYIGP